MKEILSRYGIGAIIGFAIAFIIFGRIPDVQTTTDSKLSKTKTSLDVDKTLKTATNIKGAQRIDTKPDGSASFFGPSLSFENYSEEVSRLRLRVDVLEKELSTTKTTTYSGSIAVLWNPFELRPAPAMIDASYLIFNPVEITAIYYIDQGKVFLGPRLKF